MSENFRPNKPFKEVVCIDAMRIFDSCSSQDCLEDVEFSFDCQDQNAINSAEYIKTKCIDVTDVSFAISPVAFNQGFYAVDVTYYFRAQIEVYCSENLPPVVVFGKACFTKKVILFGSDGSTQRFVSTDCCPPQQEAPVSGCAACCKGIATLPTATANIVPPMCLDTKLVPNCGCSESKTVLITIGLFAIISLQRAVPVMIPVYDYCVPEKECSTSSDTPCEMFEKIAFPTSEFFPRGLENYSCCDCEEKTQSDAEETQE